MSRAARGVTAKTCCAPAMLEPMGNASISVAVSSDGAAGDMAAVAMRIAAAAPAVDTAAEGELYRRLAPRVRR